MGNGMEGKINPLNDTPRWNLPLKKNGRRSGTNGKLGK